VEANREGPVIGIGDIPADDIPVQVLKHDVAEVPLQQFWQSSRRAIVQLPDPGYKEKVLNADLLEPYLKLDQEIQVQGKCLFQAQSQLIM